MVKDITGFGTLDNLVARLLLEYILSPEDQKEYRKELKKKNSKAYNSFLEYEKALEKK